MSKTFARMNPASGLIEIIDVVTGHIVAVQKDPFDLFNGHRELLVETTMPDGTKVLMQKGVDARSLIMSRGEPFNQIIVDLICEEIATGGNLTAICKKPGYPKYSTLERWKREHGHVKEQLEYARNARAEYYRDKALDEAEKATSSKDDINAHNLRVDTYKWAAGMDDQKYSPKSKVEATLNAPVQIMVSTGIDRTKLPEKEVGHEQIEATVGNTGNNGGAETSTVPAPGTCAADQG